MPYALFPIPNSQKPKTNYDTRTNLYSRKPVRFALLGNHDFITKLGNHPKSDEFFHPLCGTSPDVYLFVC